MGIPLCSRLLARVFGGCEFDANKVRAPYQ